VREAYQKYIGRNFRHHNPFFRGDAASLRIAMEENAAKNPNKVLRALEDGDLVAVHSRVSKSRRTGRGGGLHFQVRGRSRRRALGHGPACAREFTE
jgi:predicted SnoaL-like aldol condensation-catalyzing enzyme